MSTDAGGMPIYRVVAVEGGKAWVQNDRRPTEVMPINRFHWKAAAQAK